MINPDTTLYNIAEGSVEEKFAREFKKVLKNLTDINTTLDKRSIKITIDFKPFEQRDGADISVNVETKLAGAPNVKSRIFIEESDQTIKARNQIYHPELDFGSDEV